MSNIYTGSYSKAADTERYYKRVPGSNTDFVLDLMEYSKNGAMMQMVVLEALRFYSNMISVQPEPEEDTKSIIPERALWRAACELRMRLEERNTKSQ